MAWQKGQSGNPNGRKLGSLNRATEFERAATRADRLAIVQRVISDAKNGDNVAARIVLDRLYPIRRGRPVFFELPSTETLGGALSAIDATLSAVGRGELTPDEGKAVADLIGTKIKVHEAIELEERLRKVEEALSDR